MDMQELLKQAKNARRSGQQNEAIRLCTEVIKQSSDDQDIVKAYLLRGEAYSMKGNYEDYGHATKDLSVVIDLIDDTEPKELYKFYLAKAHLLRGESERMRDNLNLTIKDCTKVIDEIKPDDENLMMYAHYIRGWIYVVKNDPDHAVEDFTEFINLAETVKQPEDMSNLAQARLMRGDLEIKRGNYGPTIEDISKVISEITSKSELFLQDNLLLVSAYALRGLAYFYSEDEDYDKAFDDFSEGYALDSSSVLSKLAFFFFFFQQSKEIEEPQRRILFHNLAPLYKIILNILNESFFRKGEVVHYTSASTTASLVEKESRFRLYNTSMMNDPEEGRILFKMMGNSEDYYQKFYEEDDSSSPSSEAYIGSFMPEDNRDVLLFWRLYGKDHGSEAMGCCLTYTAQVFQENFSSDEFPLSGTKMPESPSDRSFIRGSIVPRTKEEDLFSVFYKDTDEVEKLTDKISEIRKCLHKILKMREQTECENHRLFINACVRRVLDYIRFLFKSKHYKEERELRIIKLQSPSPDSSNVETEVTDGVPRLYMELNENFRPEEIVLGPRINSSDAWVAFIRSRGISKVSLSKVPFRG